MNNAFNHGSQGDFFASLNFSTPAAATTPAEDSHETRLDTDSQGLQSEWPPAGPGEKLRLG